MSEPSIPAFVGSGRAIQEICGGEEGFLGARIYFLLEDDVDPDDLDDEANFPPLMVRAQDVAPGNRHNGLDADFGRRVRNMREARTAVAEAIALSPKRTAELRLDPDRNRRRA